MMPLAKLAPPDPAAPSEPARLEAARALPDGATRQRALLWVLVALTVFVGGLSLGLFIPFLPAMVWALALAIVAFPLHRWVERRLGGRATLAAGTSVALIALVIIAPVAMVGQAVVAEGVKVTRMVQRQVKDQQWRKTIEGKPRLEQIISWVESQEGDVTDQLHGAATTASRWAGAGLARLGKAGTTLLLTLFVLFFFLRDQAAFLRYTRGLLPFSEAESDVVFSRVKDTIYATLYGTVLVRGLQGTLGGLMFWWLGLPAPLLWGAVMAVMSLVPVLGAFVVWVPAAIFLVASGEAVRAIVLTAWGVGVIGTVDNVLYPTLVGDRLKMHTLPVFVAMVGGLSVFGAAGLVLGPVVLRLGDTMVTIWRERTAEGKPAQTAGRAEG